MKILKPVSETPDRERPCGARIVPGVLLLSFLLFPACRPARAQAFYLGFDQNQYPGDGNLASLRKTFAFSSFWLNDPPKMNNNPWAGKRSQLLSHGFGFVLLFNGRLDAQLKGRDAADLGRKDGAGASASAHREGFPSAAVIFLDQEEGGRMLPEQAAYIGGWIAAVKGAGFKAGVYCSGIAVPDGKSTISTAEDIHARFPEAKLWVANDQCPPAPGCRLRATKPSDSGFSAAEVWQFSQSPRRPQYTAKCASTYAADGNCYAPGMPHTASTFLDLNTATNPDPSGGR